MKVIFSNRAYTALLSEVYEKIQTETGGVFLGYYENDIWYIVEAIDPGPNCIFEVAYFEYDQPYVNHLINKVARIYKNNLALIGLWHRHPGSFDVFSGTDDGTNATYAKMSPQGAISVLVNIDPLFRLTVYHVSYPLRYKRIKYEVGDELFPEGLLSLHDKEDYIRFINTYEGRANSNSARTRPKVSFTDIINETCNKITSIDVAEYKEEIYEATKDLGYIDEISNVIDEDLVFLAEELSLKLSVKIISNFICVIDDQNPDTRAYFSWIKSVKKYVFSYNNHCYLYDSGLFKKTILSNQHENEKGGLFNTLRKLLGL